MWFILLSVPRVRAADGVISRLRSRLIDGTRPPAPTGPVRDPDPPAAAPTAPPSRWLPDGGGAGGSASTGGSGPPAAPASPARAPAEPQSPEPTPRWRVGAPPARGDWSAPERP